MVASLLLCLVADVGVREDTFEDRPHFVVETDNATAWLDRRSGGLSRLIDGGGRDWIAFRMKPWGEYPAAAAGAFRGFPNMVFGDDPDAGFGHPGHDTGRSAVTEQGEHVVIDAKSESGRWAIRWTFTDADIAMAVTRTPDDAKYWVLYEGPVGGSFDPAAESVATPSGEIPAGAVDFFAGVRVAGVFPWAEFRDSGCDAALRIERGGPAGEGVIDTWANLGAEGGLRSSDGMTVFGFGRGPQGIDPRLAGEQTFRLQFVER